MSLIVLSLLRNSTARFHRFIFPSSTFSTRGFSAEVEKSPAAEKTRISACGDVAGNVPSADLISASDDVTGNLMAKDFLVYVDFVSEEEEKSIFDEVEPYLKRLKYESSHWDDVRSIALFISGLFIYFLTQEY